MKDFKDKVAVVTGAASGMGLAFAHKFAEEGMSVVLADIEAEVVEPLHALVDAPGLRRGERFFFGEGAPQRVVGAHQAICDLDGVDAIVQHPDVVVGESGQCN